MRKRSELFFEYWSLSEAHELVRQVIIENRPPSDSEEYELLCSIGEVLAKWPEFRMKEILKIEARYDDLMSKQREQV